MKRQVLLLILLSISFALQAQNKENVAYLYDDFRKGTLKYKSGSTSPGIFNYELVSGEIHFKDNNDALELAYPDKIESIEIGEDIFIHVKARTFYQKINLGNIDLYIKHIGSPLFKGKNIGYGYSQTASADNISPIDTGRGYAHTKPDNNEIYKVDKKAHFYIKVNGKFKHIHSAGSLAKLFKEHDKEIKEAINEENTDFRKIEDVTKAVRFCGEFLEK